jgi:ubiquinone/menaquinone biosynthesis C-methylase UbiE
MTTAPDKSSQEWGAEWSRGLWDNLFSRYDPLIDGQVVLDLGCSWGYTVKFFAENFRPAKVIGIDISPFWQTTDHGWDYEALGGLVEFRLGTFADMDEVEDASIDLVISASTFQYMTPEDVERNAAKAYAALRPGGEAIIRTRTATSHLGADLHALFDMHHPHLLYGGPAIEAVAAEAGHQLRYLNFLTASSYLAVFMRCGFEVLDAVRRPISDSILGVTDQRLRALFPDVSDSELFCADLDLRLVKAIDPKDLAGLGPG